jgi:hypothetical protein
MSILDRIGTYVAPDGMMIDGVLVLTGAERARLTIEARCAAVDAAARYVASGRSGGRSLIDHAETIEAWILREVPAVDTVKRT